MKEVIQEETHIYQYVQQVYSLFMGQCTDAMITQVKAYPKYETVFDDQDGTRLLNIIKSIRFNFQDQNYVLQSIFESKQRFYSMK